MARTQPMMTEIEWKEQYYDFINKNKKCLIFYGSENCSHCQHIKPFVYQMVKQYPDIKFAHVEVTKMQVDGIKGYPTFYGFRDRRAVDTVEGADEEALMHMLNNL